MGTDKGSQLLKIISTLKEFRTPIQLGALFIVIFFLIWIGQYTLYQKSAAIFILMIGFLLSIIPEWRRTEVDAELERRRISADLERGKHWTNTTFREMSERTRIEAVQRKQGALDVFSAIEKLLEKKLEENALSENERAVHRQILEEIKIMKAGANSFAVGFHERVEREIQDKRGRFSFMQEKKREEGK